MKHISISIQSIIGTLAYLLIGTLAFAQAPQKMSYQAVIRNASNVLVQNTTVGMQISILQGSAVGTPVYVETQTPMTNANGLASLQIGAGTIVSGTFAAIDWSNGPYFIKTETDPLGGVAYTITGTSQMLSAPYALYAEKSGSLAKPLGKTYLQLSGDITDAQAAAKIANEVGPNTQYVTIQGTTALTTIDLSSITDLLNILVSGNSMLNSINLNNLTKVENHFQISGNTVLTNLSVPLMTKIGGDINIGNHPALSSISMPSLLKSNNFLIISDNPQVTSINFNSMTTSSQIYIANMTSLNSFTFPLLSSVGEMACNANSNLTSVSLPSLISIGNGMDFRYNKFSTATVNSLLNQMLSVTPTSGRYLYLNVQSPLAPPSGAGITAKATLIANGQSIATD